MEGKQDFCNVQFMALAAVRDCTCVFFVNQRSPANLTLRLLRLCATFDPISFFEVAMQLVRKAYHRPAG